MSDGPEWGFAISHSAAAVELSAGALRESSYDDEVLWVGNNIGNPLARPSLAPSNAGWQLLVSAERNPSETRNFYKDHYAKVAGGKSDAEDESVHRRSEIQQFDLLDQFKGWRVCPHCGKDVM